MTVTFETPSLGLERLSHVCPMRMGRSSWVRAVPRVIFPGSLLVRPRAKSTSSLPVSGAFLCFLNKCCRWLWLLSPTSIICPTLSGESIHSIGSPVTSRPSLPQIPASKMTSPPTGATSLVGVSRSSPHRARAASALVVAPPLQSLH